MAAILTTRAMELKDAGFVIHDAGSILASGQELHHSFTLSNPSDRPFRLLGAEALIPCCSAVGPLPDVIPPGESARVPVQFKPGFQSGRKQVEFIVHTDDPDRPARRFALVATLISEIEVTPLESDDTALPLGQAGRQRFTVICRQIETSWGGGTQSEGRSTPSSLSASPPLTAQFLDSPTEHRADDGTMTTTRTFVVGLPATAEEGAHRGEVILRWPDGHTWSQVVAWRVIPHIQATPSGLVLKAGSTEQPTPAYTVTLHARDREFRILDVSGPILAGAPENIPTKPARSHTLTLDLDPSGSGTARVSDIRVVTDHPDQPGVSVSVFVLSAWGGEQ